MSKEDTNIVHEKDVREYVIRYCKRMYRFLWRHHWEEVEAVASYFPLVFTGPRIPKKLLQKVVARRLYHLARELGWRQRREDHCWEKNEDYLKRLSPFKMYETDDFTMEVL